MRICSSLPGNTEPQALNLCQAVSLSRFPVAGRSIPDFWARARENVSKKEGFPRLVIALAIQEFLSVHEGEPAFDLACAPRSLLGIIAL
jgi:hypothetical protein